MSAIIPRTVHVSKAQKDALSHLKQAYNLTFGEVLMDVYRKKIVPTVISDDGAYTSAVKFHLSADDYQVLQQEAQDHALTLQAYVRVLLFGQQPVTKDRFKKSSNGHATFSFSLTNTQLEVLDKFAHEQGFLKEASRHLIAKRIVLDWLDARTTAGGNHGA